MIEAIGEYRIAATANISEFDAIALSIETDGGEENWLRLRDCLSVCISNMSQLRNNAYNAISFESTLLKHLQ